MSAQRARQAIHKFTTALLNLETELAISDDGDKTSRNSVLLTLMLCFETFWKAARYVLLAAEGIEAV